MTTKLSEMIHELCGYNHSSILAKNAYKSALALEKQDRKLKKQHKIMLSALKEIIRTEEDVTNSESMSIAEDAVCQVKELK